MKRAPRKLRPLEFVASKVEREAVDMLCKFFGLRTRAKLLRHMLVFVVLDVANYELDSDWTTEQKAAWEYCQKTATEFGDAVMLVAAKKVLEKKPPDTTMSVHDLAVESLSEFMPREQLAELARQKGIDPTGLRKSGIIGKLKKC